ncbi:androgen-binding protein homolog [Mesocricetus auratus]|uniref:Androgen-binding protein homolog n=1 Tax=Mesocricetus auratus TaxID=10036 RepID=ABP_MESAU|nr:androgen-binding protein homolog [Mesocricetus auratus]Q0PGP2.1 RecName: Full=Androgen-binding protein homolog; Flags: Precursor [Mesocricetus auratus]ABH05958.1 secretoglobin precursor [Mesocricetus auratus]
MKGTLLLLALLVTGELGFQTTEACIPFYEAFGAVVLGNKQVLDVVLSKFNATDKEREAFEKIQECYNDGGLKSKLLDTRVVYEVTVNSPCKEYYTKDTILKVEDLLFQIQRHIMG